MDTKSLKVAYEEVLTSQTLNSANKAKELISFAVLGLGVNSDEQIIAKNHV